MNTFRRKNIKTFKVQMFRDDMGSYTTNAHSWEDLLWDVNSARDHDGLPHLTLEQLKDCRPKITPVNTQTEALQG
jgi:hypothetical protein